MASVLVLPSDSRHMQSDSREQPSVGGLFRKPYSYPPAVPVTETLCYHCFLFYFFAGVTS